MVVPEKILNMEVNANKEFNQLNAQVVLKTQPSTLKGKAKATDDLPAPKSSHPKAPAKGKGPKETKKETKRAEEKPKPATKSTPAPSKTKVSSGSKDLPATKKMATSRSKKAGASAPSATAVAPIASGSTKGARVGLTARKTTARKTTGGQPPVKRERVKREREDEMEIDLCPTHEEWEDPYQEQGPPRKRTRHEQPTGPFAWLAGTYQIEAPVISEEWDVGNDFTLIVSIPRLTPHLLLVEFDFGVVHGIMRSRAPIENRDDGAYATFEWCGQDSEQFEGVINYYRPGMTGYLKFVRRVDGTHTVRGKIQDFSAVGDAEFNGIWTSSDASIRSEWGDFSQTAYEYANVARWR